MHLETLSNGLGGPSMWMFALACTGEIPSRISITAHTGSERDRICCIGDERIRMGAEEFYHEYVVPMGRKYGIETYLFRAKDQSGTEKPALWDNLKARIADGTVDRREYPKLHMPLFGSQGGRLPQTCTDNWKIAAIKQCARSLGATTMRSAQGLHKDEIVRRGKGVPLGQIGGWWTFQTIHRQPKGKAPTVVKWLTHYYPLADLEMSRKQIEQSCWNNGVPYLETSECDACPHKDYARWSRTSPAVLEEIAAVEAAMGGEFFFTDRRIPLMDALAEMARLEDAKRAQGNLFGDEDLADFGCGNSYCGV